MTRDEAQQIADAHTVVVDGLKSIPTYKAACLIGEDRYRLLIDDKIRFNGPPTGGIYPWNVVDYLCLEQSVVDAKLAAMRSSTTENTAD